MKTDLLIKIDTSLENNSDYKEMTLLTLQSAREILEIYMGLESSYKQSQQKLDNEITSFKDRTQEVNDKIDEFYSSSAVTLEQVKQAQELCEAIKEQVLNYSSHIDEIQDKIESDKKEMASIKDALEQTEQQTQENIKETISTLGEIEKNKIEILKQLKETFDSYLSNLKEKMADYERLTQEVAQKIEDSKNEFQTLAEGAKTEFNAVSTDSINTINDSKNQLSTLIETSKTTLESQLQDSLIQLDNKVSVLKTDISTQTEDFTNNITSYINSSKEEINQSLKPLSNLSAMDLSHYKFTDDGAVFVSDDGVEKKFLLEGDQKLEAPSSLSVLDFREKLKTYPIPDEIRNQKEYLFFSPFLWERKSLAKNYSITMSNPIFIISATDLGDGVGESSTLPPEEIQRLSRTSQTVHSLHMGNAGMGIGISCTMAKEAYGRGISLSHEKEGSNISSVLIEETIDIASVSSNSDGGQGEISSISISPYSIAMSSNRFTFNGREVLLNR